MPKRHRTFLGLVAVALVSVAVLPAVASARTGAPADVGTWSQPVDWKPLQAKHMILLNTGKVLVWASQANSDPKLWDPVNDPTGAHMVVKPFPGGDLHCAAQVTLADGRVLVVGGQNVSTHIGIPVTALFDPVTETWTRGADMHFARWYPTASLMADGRVLVTSGDTSATVRIDTPEIYDPATDTWTDVAKPLSKQYLYPFLYQLPGGLVFEAGSRYQTQFFNPQSGLWTAQGKLAPFNTDAYSESGAMYAPGRIVRAGGGDPAKAQTAVIDTNVADPAQAQWRLTSPMHFPRRRMNLPLMLDGELLAIGGTGVGNNPTQAVLPSEIWNPETEQWTEVADIAEPRMYHSTALTLPDGRVLSAGGQVTTDGASEDEPNSTQLQYTAQVYSPPYLFKGTRPSIVAGPSQAGYNACLALRMSSATPIAKLALLRPSAVTHAIDMNQRWVPLNFTQSGTSISATAPSSAYRAAPGWYMLVAVDGDGVPSVARWILLGSGAAVQSPGAPAPIAPAADKPLAAAITALTSTTIAPGQTVDFASSWSGPPTSFSWDFGDTTKSGAAHPSKRYLNAGTYTVALTVKRGGQSAISNAITVTVVPGGTGTNLATSADIVPGAATPVTPAPQGACTPGGTTPGPTLPDDPGTPPGGGGGGTPVITGSGTVTTDPDGRRTFTPGALASVASRGNTAATAALTVVQGPGAGATNRRAFLRFDVSGLSAAPARAVLRLYTTDASGDGGSAYPLGTAWTAGAITWRTAPSVAGPSVASAGAVGRGRWVELDVTKAVTGNGFVGFGLVSTSADGAAYAASGPNGPQLVVTPAGVSKPAADFAAAPRSGTAGVTVAFADRSTGATSWAWDFQDDGRVDATSRNPRHTFRKAGTYAVRLVARSAAGQDVAVKRQLITVTAAPRASATHRYTPIADATITSVSPRRTSGSSRTLAVRQGTAASPATLRSYLKFRVRGLRGLAASAKLRLYVTGAGSDGGSVTSVGSTWSERSLSWSTAPGLRRRALSAAGATAKGTWIELDVTKAVTGDGLVSLVLSTTTADAIAYASRESVAHRPQLVVVKARGSTARQASLRRAHLASLASAHPSFVCPLVTDAF